MRDLAVSAVAPHPVGSVAQQHVRDSLLAQARAPGLQPQVQRDPATGATLAAFVLAREPWLHAVLLALAAVPALVAAVPLLALETLNVEQGPLVAVPVLLSLLGSLLPQLLLVTGRLGPAGDGLKRPGESRPSTLPPRRARESTGA